MKLVRHMQININYRNYRDAWGQASGLQAMLEGELARKKQKKGEAL